MRSPLPTLPKYTGRTAALMLIFLTITFAQAQLAYHLAKRVVLGGDGFWDYFAVDPATGHVFIPHGAFVIVLDSDGNKLAMIPGFKEAHAITFAPGLAYISDGQQATVLNTETNKIVRHIDLKDNGPDAILFDPSTRRVFAFGERAQRFSKPTPGKSLLPFRSAESLNSRSRMVQASYTSTLKTKI